MAALEEDGDVQGGCLEEYGREIPLSTYTTLCRQNSGHEMPGIADLTSDQLRRRIRRFDQRYVTHWNEWMAAEPNRRVLTFGKTLRSWNACRPNSMRRSSEEGAHAPPFLDDLVQEAEPHIHALRRFDVCRSSSFTRDATATLRCLWETFLHLSYSGRARNGLAGVVGISKAVLLLTEGRVGPAFDSEVRGQLGIETPTRADEWLEALRIVQQDIEAFELRNQTSLRVAAGRPFKNCFAGRIYDMALGPGAA